MKRLLYIISLIVLISGCGHNDHVALEHMSQAEKLIWSHPDSALSIMEGIRLKEPVSRHVRARHALLTVQTRSRMRIQPTSDSLILIALDHYKRQPQNQTRHLMRAYLYHADVLLDLGKNDAATVSLKKAESLAGKDTPLPYRFLIESNLGYINRRSGLYTHAYRHHHNAYQLAADRQDTLWMMTAVANLMTLRGYDTTRIAQRYTFGELERITPALPNYLQRKLWQNAGVWYCEKEDTATALQCYHEALSIDSAQTSTLLMLAVLHERQGDITAADSIYPQILKHGSLSQKGIVHQLLSERHQMNNDYRSAARHYQQYIQSATQVLADRDTRKILELQSEHDRLKATYKEYRRITLLTAVILLLTVSVITILAVGKRIIRHYHEKLRQQEETNAQLEETNGTLVARVGSQQKHLNQYKVICHIDEESKRIEREDLSTLNIALLMEKDHYVLQGESDYTALFRWSDIAYRNYRTRLTEAYPELKPAEVCTCCLLRHGYTIPEIARIMATSDAAVRKRIQRMYGILKVKNRQEYLNLVLELKK